MHFFLYILGGLLYNNFVSKHYIMTDNTQLIADIEDAERSFDDAAIHLAQVLYRITGDTQLEDGSLLYRELLYQDFCENVHDQIRKAFPNHDFKNF